jgi:hypothetical protein
MTTTGQNATNQHESNASRTTTGVTSAAEIVSPLTYPALPKPPEPGERCALCDRRRNKPRQTSSPDAKKIAAGKLPHERAQAVEDALDALQAFVGADSTSYPRGTLMELLVILGGQQRDELRDYFAQGRVAR